MAGPGLATVGRLENADARKIHSVNGLPVPTKIAPGFLGSSASEPIERLGWVSVSGTQCCPPLGGLPGAAIGRAKIDDGGIGWDQPRVPYASGDRDAGARQWRGADRGPLRSADGQLANGWCAAPRS